jgi:uncharacterized protein YcfJ|tara:strand:- start:151 stop:558 length:408 start_codon:yes stop_codon:yes gene_type:complete
MKLIAALLLIGATSAPAFAGGPVFRGQRNTYHESFCYKNTEEYVPGYYDKYGKYVGGYVRYNKKKVPCNNHYHHNTDPYPNVGTEDNNSCVEGSILGGILGGGAGAAMSRGDGRWWAIPLGIVSGSMVGCQVDGG